MNTLDARRRLLGRNVYKKTTEGNPAIAQGSLARMYPGIKMQGWTEQDSTTGAQLFDASKLHTKTQGGATVTNNGDGSFTISGSGNLTSVFSNPYTYPSDEATRIISREGICRLNSDFDTSVLPGFIFGLYDNIGNPITYKRIVSHSNTLSFEITQDDIDKVSSGEYALKAYFFGSANNPIHVGVVRPAVYIDGDGTWEPYTGGAPSPSPDYPQEIVSAGKHIEATEATEDTEEQWQYEIGVGGVNCIDYKKIERENNFATPTLIEDGFILNGMWYALIDNISVKPGKQYTLSFEASGSVNGNFAVYKQSGISTENVIATNNSTSGKVFTIPDDTDEVIILFYCTVSDTNGTTTYKNIMLNEGTEALPYEPYKPPQTVTLTSDRPLTKWDRLEKRNGQYGWVYKSAEIVLDGSEEWSLYAVNVATEGISFAITFDDGIGGFQTSLCDKYRNIDLAWGKEYKGKYKIYTDHMNRENKNRYFRPPSAEVETVEQWKTWLSENPIAVRHETAEETFVPLSETEQEQMNALHTNRPTTVLSNDAGCETSLTYKTRKSMEVTA